MSGTSPNYGKAGIADNPQANELQGRL